jgi:hypothetical protein
LKNFPEIKNPVAIFETQQQDPKMSEDLLISIFCSIDDFCTSFEPEFNRILLSKYRYLTRTPRLQLCEIMTIVVLFHFSKFRTFKDFYLFQRSFLIQFFPSLISYNRFIELIPRSVFPLFCYLFFSFEQCSGISFIDSTILTVCHIRRASSHKTFRGIASKGKTSTGWYFGLKLHLVINEYGGLQAFQLTSGKTHDLIPVDFLTKKLFGYLFGDKAYLSQKMFKKLYERGLKLVTKIRSNMKNKLMSPWEKIMLQARGLIESVNNRLKNGCQIEHHRYRSPINFLANLFGGLAAYQLQPKKPSIRLPFHEKLPFFSMT